MSQTRRSEDYTEIVKRFTSAQEQLVLQTADLPLGTLAEMVDGQTIDLEPSFQRRERWSIEKQSALIESFILNVPVPPIYLSEDQYGRYTAIDGKQRLRTICDFIYGRFRLKKIKEFTQIEGRTFLELPDEIRNALKIRPFLRVVTLLKQSDPELKYEVFTRLNRGGESLNPQEIRNVAFRGPLNDLIYQLAFSEFLRKQLKIRNASSPAFREMQDAEFVLRFFSLNEQDGRYSGSLLKSMDDFMLRNQKCSEMDLQSLRASFEIALSRCQAIWGEFSFRRPEGDGWRDQTLAGMYDAEMLAVARLSEKNALDVISNRQSVLKKTRLLFNEDEFEQSVRQATNTPSRIDYRVEKIEKMLLSSM